MNCLEDLPGIKILSQLFDSSLVKHMNPVLRVFKHGLVTSTGHAEQKVLNNLFRPEIERLSMLYEVYQLLQVALSDE